MLDAAVETAAERGYESMRISEITDLIGVSRQAFYRYFRDKRHCLAEAIDPQLGAIERMTARLSESDSDSATTIAHALDDVLCGYFGSAEGTRGRILAAVGRLLAAPNTLHQITIGQIVKEAHVPQGDFYRQFSTKLECFAIYYELLVEEFVAEVEKGEAGSPECSAEHTGHELPASEGLPALLRSVGLAMRRDPQRLRVLVVESAHLPEIASEDRLGAWRGSLVVAITDLIASSSDIGGPDPATRFLAASLVEVIRAATLNGRAEGLPDELSGLAFCWSPAVLGARAEYEMPVAV